MLLYLFSFRVVFGLRFQLNIIEVIIANNPVNGYRAIAPAFDVALNDMRLLYPNLFENVTVHRIYKPGNFTCPDAAGIMVSTAAEVWDVIRDHPGFHVILSPGKLFQIFVWKFSIIIQNNILNYETTKQTFCT